MEFIKIMESISSKLWIPHQVALEFLHNRTKKILEQEKDYEEHLQAINDAKEASKKQISKKLNGIKKSFRKVNIEDLSDRIEEFFDDLREEVEEQNKNNPDFTKEDIVLKKFLSLYSDNIGLPFTKEELEDIYSEGEKRYEKEIPPGYKDLEDKKGLFKLYGDTVIKSEFGDLILWKQIIDKSKKDSQSVIFITDDTKQDWWNIEKGKKLKGPRKELINEFVNSTQQEIVMYNTESFLNSAKEVLDMEVDANAIAEVHSYIMSNKENEIRNKILDGIKDYLNKSTEIHSNGLTFKNFIEDHRDERLRTIDAIEEKLIILKREREDLEKKYAAYNGDEKKVEKILNEIEINETLTNITAYKLKDSKDELSKYQAKLLLHEFDKYRKEEG